MTGPTFERMFYANNIENQFTAHNIYMTYGGTNWGRQGDPNVVYARPGEPGAARQHRHQPARPRRPQSGLILPGRAPVQRL
jgi:Glycosyl hydrolases family 35